jgi:glycosyltransferase involved in cell wall biosynthesis
LVETVQPPAGADGNKAANPGIESGLPVGDGLMKVLVTTFGGDSGRSGVGQYIIQLLREFPSVAPDAHFDVALFEDEKDVYITDPSRTRPITCPNRLRSAMRNLAWQQVAMPRLCAREKYDVLFVPAGNRRMPYWVPCPSVGTFHDLAILHVPHKYDRLHTFYNLHVLPALVRRLAIVVAISESTKRDLMEYVRVPEDRIVVIPEAADTTRYYPREQSACAARIAQRYGVRPPYVLFISRIEHPGKNHVRLIRAFHRLKEAENIPHQLVLAGSDWAGAEDVHREAAASRFSSDIVFTGFVPAEDLPDFYCGADAFLFPSLFEGFGLPVLEAMACGIPVACANVSSIPEVAGDAGVLFDPLDENAITQAMRDVLTNQTVRARCVQRGLERSKAFSWTTTAARTMEVLQRAAEEGRK